jgi:protein phosphatase
MLKIVDHFWATHVGRQRKHNEDNFYPQPPVFVIADGMGGAQAGEVASEQVVRSFKSGLPPDGSAEERLALVIQDANERIHDMAHADKERAGMGTTVVAAYLGDHEVAIAHVGDARAYVMRDGELQPLTHDHTLVQALLDQQRITPEQAAVHPQRSIITRAVGPEPEVDVETHTFPLQSGDIVLMCSDGLTSMVDEGKISNIVRTAPNLQIAGRGLIDAANSAGGRDNITVILFRLGEEGDPEVARDATEDTMVRPPDPSGDDGPEQERPDKPQTGFMPSIRGMQSTLEHDAVQEAPPRRLTPRRPGEGRPARAGPRRRSRRWIAPIAIAGVLAVVVVGLWIASRAVYFVGTDSQGFVTIYRGVPYDLPAGIHLYERFYTSGVPAEIVPPGRRKKLLDHTWRSQRDAVSLVDQLELGRLTR